MNDEPVISCTLPRRRRGRRHTRVRSVRSCSDRSRRSRKCSRRRFVLTDTSRSRPYKSPPSRRDDRTSRSCSSPSSCRCRCWSRRSGRQGTDHTRRSCTAHRPRTSARARRNCSCPTPSSCTRSSRRSRFPDTNTLHLGSSRQSRTPDRTSCNSRDRSEGRHTNRCTPSWCSCNHHPRRPRARRTACRTRRSSRDRSGDSTHTRSQRPDRSLGMATCTPRPRTPRSCTQR